MAVYVDKNLCKNCGICVHFCPKNVFETSHKVNGKGYNYIEPVHQEACVVCRKCESMCPDFAIAVVQE